MLEPVQGMPLNAFIDSTVDLLASHTGLIASRRLMMETLHLLFQRRREPGTWAGSVGATAANPRLSEWIDRINNIHASGLSRLGFYREGVLYALSQILYSFGPVIDYASSDMLEQLIQFNGVVVINTDGLDPHMGSFLAGFIIKQAYDSRASYFEQVDHHPVFFMLDDAMRLVTGSVSDEAEGDINPLSTWAFMGRSRKIGFIVAAQNFNLISPALKNNTATTIVMDSMFMP